MEPPMSTAINFATKAPVPGRPRFVLVNDRVPRSDASCSLCGNKIEQGYLRQLQTGLVYCNPQCLFGQERMTLFAIEDRTRKAS